MSNLIKRLLSENVRNGYIELDEKSLLSGRIKDDDETLEYLSAGTEYALDSELLLSLIYKKLGLKNPQSYPAKYKDSIGVIRSDLRHDKNYIKNELNNYRSNCIYFSSLTDAKRLHPFYDKNLMDSYIKMSIADVIFGVQDRFKSHMFVHKDKFGYIDSVAPIHYFYPGYSMTNEVYHHFQTYYNGVVADEETKGQYRKRLKTFDFKNFITPEEVFEILRKLDIKACAKEVYETTHHKINPKFVDYLNKTIEENVRFLSTRDI